MWNVIYSLINLQCVGKIGRLKGSDSSGVVQVIIGHKKYKLSPLCVQQASDELQGGWISYSHTVLCITSDVYSLKALTRWKRILIWC